MTATTVCENDITSILSLYRFFSFAVIKRVVCYAISQCYIVCSLPEGGGKNPGGQLLYLDVSRYVVV